ncbi:MAG: CheR family methyltransferase, partial [Gemmatimonadaceae bacterium]
AHANVSDPGRFADLVSADAQAFAAALMELTIGETYFFRDPGQWKLVREDIVPDLMRAHPDGLGVRAWSAGCASGEEAYTLGIVLREAGCLRPTVIGTDLCEHRLARASRGVYTKWSMRGLDDTMRRRYFEERGQHFHLKPEHAEVRFRPVNLAGTGYGEGGQELSQLDLILCRNVLIYIDAHTVDEIFRRLVRSLRDGGWLMVAASDPQPQGDLGLETVLTGAGLLYRKRAPGAARAVDVSFTRAFAELAPFDRAMTPVTALPPRPVAPIAIVPPAVSSPQEQLSRAYARTDYALAVRLASEIIHAGADTPLTWVRLARSHANRGDLTAAREVCANGITRHPDAAELHVVASALEAQEEHFVASAQAARRALYLDRSLAVAQLALGTAMLRTGDGIAADRALRAAERMLAAMGPREIVDASDGATAYDLLSATRAHRAILEERLAHAG